MHWSYGAAGLALFVLIGCATGPSPSPEEAARIEAECEPLLKDPPLARQTHLKRLEAYRDCKTDIIG